MRPYVAAVLLFLLVAAMLAPPGAVCAHGHAGEADLAAWDEAGAGAVAFVATSHASRPTAPADRHAHGDAHPAAARTHAVPVEAVAQAESPEPGPCEPDRGERMGCTAQVSLPAAGASEPVVTDRAAANPARLAQADPSSDPLAIFRPPRG